MTALLRVIWIVVWFIAYCGLGMLFEMKKIIVQPAYFSFYGMAMLTILIVVFKWIRRL